MNTFSKGDSVELDMSYGSNTSTMRKKFGWQTLTVALVRGSYICLEGHYGSFFHRRFKYATTPIRVEDAPVTEFVVMVVQYGKYAPAAEPRVYSSLSQAKAVAASMAKKHGGRFVVFKTVADAEMPVQLAPRVREYAA